MTFPNLPTDNLYKLMTIGGIALVIFSYWSYFSQYDAAIDRLYAASENIEKVAARIKTNEFEIESIDQLTPARLEKLHADIVSNYRDNLVTLAEVNAAQREIERVRGRFGMFALLSCFGAVMMSIGVTFWYCIYQRAQDVNASSSVSSG